MFSLGKGSYGEVIFQDGNAVKKFNKLSHLIQEYVALKYLDKCNYIVRLKDVDFNKLELHMELYDYSLREWLNNKHYNEDKDVIIHNILMGLMELHDRQLAHGDIKPSNILIKNKPLKAVLGDCGFVSIYKYAKIRQTARSYRDPIINHDLKHDMFSLGICLFEIISGNKIYRQKTYEELKSLIKYKIKDDRYYEIISNLLHKNRDKRPTARYLLEKLFNINPIKWLKPNIIIKDPFKDSITSTIKNQYNQISEDDGKYIRDLMQSITYDLGINRGKIGYGALLTYINNNKIDPSEYIIYAGITLLILSSSFGKVRFQEEELTKLCRDNYSQMPSQKFIYNILGELLSNNDYINILLYP